MRMDEVGFLGPQNGLQLPQRAEIFQRMNRTHKLRYYEEILSRRRGISGSSEEFMGLIFQRAFWTYGGARN